ncbi:hypothetical protein ACFQ1M_09765 [Sungkyunkwania multivorans]|uniref:Uncharacterized protein n=1 Tax=Sungkyunkwania multivorans TaxID=1173618 RepID=A0ABW3CXT7_9FLAO
MKAATIKKRKGNSNIQKVKGTAAKAVRSIGDTVVTNSLPTLYIVGGIVGAILIVSLVRTASKRVTGILTGDPDIDDQVEGTGGSTVGATISNQTAINFAQQLLDAMNAKQPFWGTDEDVILAVFRRIDNGQDFLKVFDAFGNKDYNGHNSPPEGFFSNLDSYEPRNLVYWLQSELGPGDGEVYDLVKERVNQAGFSFA